VGDNVCRIKVVAYAPFILQCEGGDLFLVTKKKKTKLFKNMCDEGKVAINYGGVFFYDFKERKIFK